MVGYYKYLMVCITAITFCNCKEVDSGGSESPHIYKFTVIAGSQHYEGLIDEEQQSINVEVPMTVSLGELLTEVVYTKGCKLTPKEGFKVCYEKIVPFRLENENGQVKVYQVQVSQNKRKIDIADDRVRINGCLYPVQQGDVIKLNRFSDEVIEQMRLSNGYFERTQPCVSIEFATNSKVVKVDFEKNSYPVDWGIDIGIYANQQFVKKEVSASFFLEKPEGEGDFITWKLLLPIMCTLDFKGITIEREATLLELSETHKPVLAAIGNSMTHGVGTGSSSYESYPFLVADSLGFDIYNLAVGGSKVSPAVANEIDRINPDLITVLWGFNDWYYVRNHALFENQYEELLRNIRASQPKKPLILINLLNTDACLSHEFVDISEYRTSIKRMYADRKAAGDNNIYLIEFGEVDLMDGIHPSVDGAMQMAKEIVRMINDEIKAN